MSVNEYRFIDKWSVKATIQEVYDIMSNGANLKEWWPSIYLDSQEVEPGDEKSIGKTISFHAQGGRLPYTLHWTARTIESRKPHGFKLEASGDFVGTGEWSFKQDGDWVNMTFEWIIRADAAVLRLLSPIVRPILANNHRYAMRLGEQSLKLELARLHVRTVNARTRIPPPPGVPNTLPATVIGLSVGTLFIAGLILLARRAINLL